MPSYGQDAIVSDEDVAGTPVVVSQSGEPFCTDRVELQDYRSATATDDHDALQGLESCSTFKGSLKVRVLATFPGSDVVRARVYVDRGSIDGFTVVAALAPR